MDPSELEAELDDILRELLRAPGMLAVALARENAAGLVEKVALADDWFLWLATAEPPPPELTQAIARAQRALKSSLRRHTGEEVPELVRWGAAPRGRDALVQRIERFLAAFLNVHGAAAVFLLRGTALVASAGDTSEPRRERLAFLRKRIDAEAARRRGTSHGEVAGDDVFAVSFWFDAYLIIFFDRPYPIDFVRYRTRNMSRDLAVLLPHLDDDPPSPANVHPLPPRS